MLDVSNSNNTDNFTLTIPSSWNELDSHDPGRPGIELSDLILKESSSNITEQICRDIALVYNIQNEYLIKMLRTKHHIINGYFYNNTLDTVFCEGNSYLTIERCFFESLTGKYNSINNNIGQYNFYTRSDFGICKTQETISSKKHNVKCSYHITSIFTIILTLFS